MKRMELVTSSPDEEEVRPIHDEGFGMTESINTAGARSDGSGRADLIDLDYRLVIDIVNINRDINHRPRRRPRRCR